jgi:hypothetical protein
MIPAVGYRLWRVDRADGWTGTHLQSLVAETLWPPRERLVAACSAWLAHRRGRPVGRSAPPHVSPAPECSCGAHAFHDLRQMLRQADELESPDADRFVFGGAVLCWGRVVIHPEGIRAQYARPLALCRPRDREVSLVVQRNLREVADTYAVPLIEADHLVAYAHEFGTSYRPEPQRVRLLGRAREAFSWLRWPRRRP